MKRPEFLFYQRKRNTSEKDIRHINSDDSKYLIDFENKQKIEEKYGQNSFESNDSCLEFVCGSCFRSFEASEDLNDHMILYHSIARSYNLKKHEENLLKENELKIQDRSETFIKNNEEMKDPNIGSCTQDPFFYMPPLIPIHANLNDRKKYLSAKFLPSFKATFSSNSNKIQIPSTSYYA